MMLGLGLELGLKTSRSLKEKTPKGVGFSFVLSLIHCQNHLKPLIELSFIVITIL